jgi:DTW domain-containing protein YfiP
MTKCPRCLLLQRVCLCAEVPTVATRTRVVIVRHDREQSRSSNTGRLAHQALPNSVIVDHNARNESGLVVPTVLPPLDGAWLLFPAGEPTTGCPEPPPRQLVVLDATWSQARRMYRKIEALRGLPILRLPDIPVSTARLRQSPGEGRVSTIEAIAAALRLLEGGAVAEPLERLFSVAVERARASGLNVSIPPTLDER